MKAARIAARDWMPWRQFRCLINVGGMRVSPGALKKRRSSKLGQNGPPSPTGEPLEATERGSKLSAAPNPPPPHPASAGQGCKMAGEVHAPLPPAQVQMVPSENGSLARVLAHSALTHSLWARIRVLTLAVSDHTLTRPQAHMLSVLSRNATWPYMALLPHPLEACSARSLNGLSIVSLGSMRGGRPTPAQPRNWQRLLQNSRPRARAGVVRRKGGILKLGAGAVQPPPCKSSRPPRPWGKGGQAALLLTAFETRRNRPCEFRDGPPPGGSELVRAINYWRSWSSRGSPRG